MTSTAPPLATLEAEFGAALFPRGFVLSHGAPVFAPAAWIRVQLDTHIALSHDAALGVKRADKGTASIVILGDAYSVDLPEADVATIAANLARTLHRSKGAYFRSLDRLHGRFALVSRRGTDDTWHVTTDATGMRATFFSAGARFVGSHPALVAANTGAEPTPIAIRGYGLPGLSTGFSDVLLLPPNQELDLADGSLRRYWPRRPITPCGRRRPQTASRSSSSSPSLAY